MWKYVVNSMTYEAGEKEMVAGDDLHRALWHREPVFRYDARVV